MKLVGTTRNKGLAQPKFEGSQPPNTSMTHTAMGHPYNISERGTSRYKQLQYRCGVDGASQMEAAGQFQPLRRNVSPHYHV